MMISLLNGLCVAPLPQHPSGIHRMRPGKNSTPSMHYALQWSIVVLQAIRPFLLNSEQKEGHAWWRSHGARSLECCKVSLNTTWEPQRVCLVGSKTYIPRSTALIATGYDYAGGDVSEVSGSKRKGRLSTGKSSWLEKTEYIEFPQRQTTQRLAFIWRNWLCMFLPCQNPSCRT